MMATRAAGTAAGPWTARSGCSYTSLRLREEHDHTRAIFIALVLAGMAYALSQTVVSLALLELQ